MHESEMKAMAIKHQKRINDTIRIVLSIILRQNPASLKLKNLSSALKFT